jgi:short-subunit dehydrogenase
MPILYLGAYNASKFAVVAFSEVLYHENRNRGVRFGCVCPPPVSTPLLKQAEETVWVFPGRGTKMGWRMRRMFPGLMWKQIHKTEGF